MAHLRRIFLSRWQARCDLKMPIHSWHISSIIRRIVPSTGSKNQGISRGSKTLCHLLCKHVQALPLPQTKQSRWHAKQPRSRLGRPEKGCTSLTPCKAQAALPNQASACLVWLASGYQKKRFGWLLAIKIGFWLASGWLVLTWLKLAGPPRCLGAALCRHCPSHKRSKVDSTIRACEAAQASIALKVPKKAALP